MDNFKALPKLNEKLEEMVSSGEARLATVVASYGNEVEVIVTGGARARFPSTHYDPPVGSSGALIATRGGGRLFIPMGIAIPIPFNGGTGQSGGDVRTTTNTATYASFSAGSVRVPPGTYRIKAVATVPMMRSVSTGAMYAQAVVGSHAQSASVDMTAARLGTERWLPVGIMINGTTSTTNDGDIELAINFRGASTAGTTLMFMATIHGTLTRIG